MAQTEPGVSTPSEPSQWDAAVARMPRPDPEDKILKNIRDGQIEQIVEEVWRGGSGPVVALLKMIRDPADPKTDSPVRHLLQAVVTRASGRGEQDRHSVAMALLVALDNPQLPIYTRAFIIQLLQACAGPEAVGALTGLLGDDALGPNAAMALLAIGPRAAGGFRSALPNVTGPRRVAVIQALGTLKDRDSIEALRRAATRDVDPVARMAAAWALANIGDEASADVVLAAADNASGFERTRATNACFVLAENLASAGKAQAARSIYQHLVDSRSGKESYVVALAEKALQAAE